MIKKGYMGTRRHFPHLIDKDDACTDLCGAYSAQSANQVEEGKK